MRNINVTTFATVATITADGHKHTIRRTAAATTASN
jgi:hypothetical protein